MYITGRGRGGERCYPERDLEQYSCSTTWEGGGGRRQTGPRSSQGAAEMFAAPLASRNTWRARVPRLLLDDARRAPAPSPPPQSCAFAGFAREFVDRRSAARARSEGAARAEGRVSPAASARPLFSFPKIPKDSLQNKPPAFLQLLQSRVSPGASALRTHRRPGPSSFSSCARFQQRQA